MPRSRPIRLMFAFVGLLVVVGVLGRGLPVHAAHAQVQTDTFVGKLDGRDAFIGVGTDGFTVTAYICDGANNTLGDNFTGTVDQASGGVLTLQADNGDLLSLNFDQTNIADMFVPDGSITGALTTVDGNSFTFSTEAAAAPGGLFLSGSQMMPDGSTADGGWVVLNDGEVRGSFSLPGSDYGHSGFLNGMIQFAPSVLPQLNRTQLPFFAPNLNQVFSGGGGPLTLPVLNQPVVFVLVVFRFPGGR